MIIDKLENIQNYKISPKVIDFLKSLNAKTSTGRYEIDEGIYANIDEYNPKDLENCKFEAHKKYIDIQMLIEGEEEIDCINTEKLTISEPYDENRDVMFFKNTQEQSDKIKLEPYKFIFIYPYEAHKPQIKTTFNTVKKVVVKIKIGV